MTLAQRLAASVTLVVLSTGLTACRNAASLSAAQAPAEAAQHEDIRHLAPEPDSVGPQPVRFAWTAASVADTYTFRIWNEVDVRIMSQTGLTVTAIDFPPEQRLPAGTYFWAVVGMRGSQPVAESGLAAFVVREP